MVKILKTINYRFQYFQWKCWKQELGAMKIRWHSHNINETLIYIFLLLINVQGREPKPSPIASCAPRPLHHLLLALPPFASVTTALCSDDRHPPFRWPSPSPIFVLLFATEHAKHRGKEEHGNKDELRWWRPWWWWAIAANASELLIGRMPATMNIAVKVVASDRDSRQWF